MKEPEIRSAKELPLVKQAETYARHWHDHTRHTYDEHPYHVHLEMVVNEALPFIGAFSLETQAIILASCWCHDLIEDARQTYNDVSRELNADVAEIAYALTNEKGRTRAERANSSYYRGIKQTPYATLVKLCDRLANVRYSLAQESRMYRVYKSEYPKFRQQLYEPGKYEKAWSKLEALIYPKKPLLT